jgi:hypothetical protein
VAVPPESIEIGKCYLVKSNKIRRVIGLMSDDRVHYEQRRGLVRKGHPWPYRTVMSMRSFSAAAQREVPCDCTPARGSEVQRTDGETLSRAILHGDIDAILTPLVRDGVITGFWANLPTRTLEGEAVITVTAPRADEIDGIWDKVRQALDMLPVDVVVRVDLP